MIEKGMKFDTEKPRVDLLDPLALEGLAAVLAFGAKKYDAHNWRGGIKYSRLLGAALRHIFAIVRGEDLDPESGKPHVDHLGCCWMFLSNMMKTRPDLDDRFKEKKNDNFSTSGAMGSNRPTGFGNSAACGQSQVGKSMAQSISHPSDCDFNYWSMVQPQSNGQSNGIGDWLPFPTSDVASANSQQAKQSVSHWGLL